MVVELRDKVGLASSNEAENLVTRGGVCLLYASKDAVNALCYSELDAHQALQNVVT